VCARWRRARRGHLSDPAWSGSDLLAGWNGPEGRTLKANQYLLWQAIAHLKQRGLRWFDLGGFNEERNPGIAAFRLGLHGERYESVGEFWKW
jgi:lipid II:glycine glycyltransferase (peptidoglycan interpeptide bridge formation enzyme)